jgi:hypothetical protein
MIKARAVISGSCADAGMYGLNEEADVSFGIELPFLLSMKSPYCCISPGPPDIAYRYYVVTKR